jgi:uncharacterized membrane protein
MTPASKTLVHSAIATLIALGLGSGSLLAAEDHSKDEKCAGIIKAGKNDCATSMNQCHGHVKTDSNPEAWIYVPKGTCDKIAGAHTTNAIDPTPGVTN